MQDGALDLISPGRRHCQRDKKSPGEVKDDAPDCIDSPRECEKCGQGEYIRLSLAIGPSSPFKAKGEELFSSVRIRSEKQISCMLEKQCLILKTGDWVFRGANRWEVLRNQEEKDAYLQGKMIGELFLFDRIDSKAGQKFVQGTLFNLGRTEAIALEIAVSSQRKSPSHKEISSPRKAKGK